MPIPRLPPASASLDVTFTINKNMRPYFAQWFQGAKREGETPEQFTLRILRKEAKTYHLNSVAAIIKAEVDTATEAAAESLRLDVVALESELE